MGCAPALLLSRGEEVGNGIQELKAKRGHSTVCSKATCIDHMSHRLKSHFQAQRKQTNLINTVAPRRENTQKKVIGDKTPSGLEGVPVEP